MCCAENLDDYCCGCSRHNGTHAEAEVTPYQAEETARLIAALLSTGRVVIDRNQSLIDDPNKGAKGFTPEVFERQVINEFRTRTGVDLTTQHQLICLRKRRTSYERSWKRAASSRRGTTGD